MPPKIPRYPRAVSFNFAPPEAASHDRLKWVVSVEVAVLPPPAKAVRSDIR